MPGLAGSGRGSKKQRFLNKKQWKRIDFECQDWPGAGGGQKNNAFLNKIHLKSIDFDCQDWPGPGGGQKSNDFYLKSFFKKSILSARARRERAGIKKATIFY